MGEGTQGTRIGRPFNVCGSHPSGCIPVPPHTFWAFHPAQYRLQVAQYGFQPTQLTIPATRQLFSCAPARLFARPLYTTVCSSLRSLQTSVEPEPEPDPGATPQDVDNSSNLRYSALVVYGSVCSGIEAATLAWEPLGWKPAWFAETSAFPAAVLSHHYPEVKNHGDFTRLSGPQIGRIDLLVGGTPCQSFSVAGRRGGLDDPRGNLAIEFCRLAGRLRPRWVVWENVPGVLSSNGGRDFGTILGALAQLGYGCAWRVLDAQFFGVPQRRRRVFVVGHLGDWRRAAAVLLERQGMCRNPPARRKTPETVASGSVCGAEIGSFGGRFTDLAPTLDARCRHSAIRNQTGMLVFDGGNTSGAIDAATTLTHGVRLDFDTETFVVETARRCDNVRRLTPRECERLQGFPDDYTLVPYRGKPAADGPRYSAIGNSMAVPVMRWIGERIQSIDHLD